MSKSRNFDMPRACPEVLRMLPTYILNDSIKRKTPTAVKASCKCEHNKKRFEIRKKSLTRVGSSYHSPAKAPRRPVSYSRIVRRRLNSVPHLEYEVLKLIRILHRHSVQCSVLKDNFKRGGPYRLINEYLRSLK